MKKNDILVLLVPSLLIVLLWVIFNVYHSFVTTTIPSNLNTSILPISADFDEKSIENIRSRGRVSPIYEISGQNIVEAEVTPEIPIVSSPSAVPSPGGALSQ